MTMTMMDTIRIANRLADLRQLLDVVAHTTDQEVNMMTEMAIDSWCRADVEVIRETVRI
jgi:hypothetical protein